METKIDIIINKTTTVENCLNRIRQTYSGTMADVENFDKQDILILNLQRACQAVIDLGMHICVKEKLGAPQKSTDAFEFLHKAGIISFETSEKMVKMVGFRNTAVREYQSLNLKILKSILDNHLTDFTDFTAEILRDIKLG